MRAAVKSLMFGYLSASASSSLALNAYNRQGTGDIYSSSKFSW